MEEKYRPKYGRRGGLSSLNDWRKYYGEEAYKAFIEGEKRKSEELAKKRAERAKEQRERVEAIQQAIREDPGLYEIFAAEAYDAEVAAYDEETYGDYGDDPGEY